MYDNILTFNKFSMENLKKCIAVDGFNHSLDRWSLAEWTNALAGEVGEACNITKKILRNDQSLFNKAKDLNNEKLKKLLVYELADVITYADLGIQAVGFVTEDILIDKFNSVSKRLKYPVKL